MRGRWNRFGEAWILGVPLLANLFMIVTIIAQRFW